ncbi:MAG: hypothetical protein JWN66_3696 [Sphingomonas bacterium]|uniref:hypothetical protein n=1 Tax=Sphingomonas bacterium TaxID=1895847 RepID=UPI0026363B74|nr:hypothetical protein [Sphingomonas bacterium]MDB5706580.1 hypothetical protein [Sphingomonas bacterium]
MTARTAPLGALFTVPVFFGLRVGSGLLLLKLSANFLPVDGFATFSQLLLFGALLNMIAVGGAQNGLIRQVAAAEDAGAIARAQGAAFAIWLGALALLAIPLALASGAISVLLMGVRDHAGAVTAITLLSLIAGPAQIWCGILTGRKMVTASLTAQALGLFAGTALAAWMTMRGQAADAAIGFAAGSLVTLGVSFLLVSRLRIAWMAPHHLRDEIRKLLGYSTAFVGVTSATSLALFGLRSLYRETFGTTDLGFWLVANRISDTSTQLLGLFMIQFFVPWFTAAKNAEERRKILLSSWVIATAVMGSFLLVFSLVPDLLVRLLLSEAYIPAIGAIRTYMVGDMLRVWASLAMFTAFAMGRPGRYAAIEIGAILLMAAITLVLMHLGDVRAPMIGYVGAYGTVAAIVTVLFLARRRPL